jgi:hypothetical protein
LVSQNHSGARRCAFVARCSPKRRRITHQRPFYWVVVPQRAGQSPGLETFQIDTYALRLVLHIEELSRDPEIRRFEEVMEKSELILSMIMDENRWRHAIQVLEGFEPFVRARVKVMTTPEKDALIFQLGRLEEALEALPVDAKAETGSNSIKKALASARATILRSPK